MTLNVRIKKALPHAEVDHVGSSAIKNAISKGDLDILVRVNKESMDEGIQALPNLGFKIKEDTLRTDSLCMTFTNEFPQDVAVQLVARGSEFEDFFHFRDRLNSKPELVEQYNQLKRESTGLELYKYRAKKSAFIQKVLLG